MTKVLFSRAEFRVRRLGSSTLMRHKEAVLGILQFIKDNEDFMDEYFEELTDDLPANSHL